MTWFKVDDSFHSHPKVLATSPAALGLWVVAGAWSGANLTDGFIPDHVLPRLLPDSAPLAAELVRTGLWKRSKGGYQFHDWGDYNPNSSAVKKERDAARERMRKLRANRKGKGQPANGSPEQPANVRDAFGGSSQPRPDPTRTSKEVPSPPASPAPPTGGRDDGEAPAEKPKRDTGTRLPDDFPVTDDMTAWARANTPLCGQQDHEAFCDYWRSVPGAKGRKKDWPATWRNWMRREQERRAARTHQRPGGNVVALPTGQQLTGTDARVAGWLALSAELDQENPR